MNRLNPTRAAIFIIVLAAIAVVLYFPIYQHRQRSAQTEQQHQSAFNAAVAHTNYMAHYLNSGFSRQADVKMIALIAASEGGKPDSAIGDALSRHLKADGVKILPSLFKTEFISDGLFNKTFNGSSDICRDLELTNVLDGILMAREAVDYTPTLDNMTTANMRLEVVVQAITPNAENQSWTFSSTGVGVKRQDARDMAEERIIKQIMNDTNMTLRAAK